MKEVLYHKSCRRTQISQYYFKKKEDISFSGIACFSLSRLKLFSMALELILSLLAHSDVSLANILPINCLQIYAYVHYKGLS